MKEVDCAVPVSKRGYVDLVQQLPLEVKKARRKFEFARRELVERHGKIKELNLKVQMLAHDSETLARIQA